MAEPTPWPDQGRQAPSGQSITIKEGWRTTEMGTFATSVVAVLAAWLVSRGWLRPEDKGWLTHNLTDLISLVVAAGTVLAGLRQYIKSRTAVKVAAIQAVAQVESARAVSTPGSPSGQHAAVPRPPACGPGLSV
jgi:hypothetical protein